MKTMFVTHNSADSTNKRKFQKPNILRRKTKVSHKISNPKPYETTILTINIGPNQQVTHVSHLNGLGTASNNINRRVQPKLVQGVVVLDSYEEEADKNHKVSTAESNLLDNDIAKTVPQNAVVGNHVLQSTLMNAEHMTAKTLAKIGKHSAQPREINVESFLNINSTVTQSTQGQDDNNEINSNISNVKKDWCLDFINEAQQIIIEDYNGSELASLHSTAEPTAQCTVNQDQSTKSAILVPIDGEQQLSTIYILPSFECDLEGCNKSFKSKERLTRHKRTHTSTIAVKEPRPHTVVCPAKKAGCTDDEPCGQIFLNRDALTEHIKGEHTLDDSIFVCVECGRRFFYRLGLRAHSRAHISPASKPALVCSWPGCGRLFQQPCRLREHQRAHTGDKPYPCNYPNCNWSFRNASKLMRHARRHTGERRHACSVCGHAFPRREHLRDHVARHHTKQTCHHKSCHRDPNLGSTCKHKGAIQKVDEAISNKISSDQPDTPLEDLKYLYLVTKPPTKTANKSNARAKTETKTMAQSKPKETLPVHSKMEHQAEIEDDIPWRVYSTTDNEINENTDWQQTEASEDDWYITQAESQADSELPPQADLQAESNLETDADSQEEVDVETEWHAARTHCTWPLQSKPANVFQTEEAQYSLEDDVQVELSEEGSESNTYTIRSDLFLHGNLLTNEDSEHIPSVSASLPGPVSDTGLSLLDAHPTIDLMQDDLMYTDAAVDESSFRVLLLNGEELV